MIDLQIRLLSPLFRLDARHEFVRAIHVRTVEPEVTGIFLPEHDVEKRWQSRMTARIKPHFHPSHAALRDVARLLLRRTQGDVDVAHVGVPAVPEFAEVVAGILQPLVVFLSIRIRGRTRIRISYFPKVLNEFFPSLVCVEPLERRLLLISNDVADILFQPLGVFLR